MAPREARLHEALLQAHGGGAEWLSDPISCGILPVPCIMRSTATFPLQWFQFVGRSRFKDLLTFAEGLMAAAEGPAFWGKKGAEPKDEPVAKQQRIYLPDDRGCEAYVIGTPGEGKSYMFAALAGFLHRKGVHVVVYISALSFSKHWAATLRSSLMVAFARDDATLSQLASSQDKDLLHYLSFKPKLMILVDDYNELDDNRTLHPQNPNSVTAKGALENLAAKHVVIYCCSCKSQVRGRLNREPYAPYLLIAGGFTEEELRTFESGVVDQVIPSGVFERTGHNPRLLKLYVQGALDPELANLRGSLRRFILDLDEVEYSILVAEIAGGDVTPLPKAMDTRCFYVSGGELTAISDHFKSAAFAICAVRDTALRRETVEEHIGCFTKVVKLDGGKNMVRVGWNAEEASLLVLSNISVTIPLVDGNWNFEATAVKTFQGGMKGASLEAGSRSIVHVPNEFNCQAVDVLLEGKMAGKTVCAGIQISASKDPQGGHGGAIDHFCSVMKASQVHYDIYLFIWIGHFPGNFLPRKIEANGVKLTEVTLSFNSLSSLLLDLDVVCEQVRSGELRNKERLPCPATTVRGEKCRLTFKPDAIPQLCHVHSRQMS